MGRMINVKAVSLLETAREANIKLPRGEGAREEAKRALQLTYDGAQYNMEAALKVLEKNFGTKKGAKRKTEAEDEGEPSKRGKSASSKKVSKEASSASNAPPSKASAVLDEVWDVSDKKELKGKAAKLVEIAVSRGVKMPEDEAQARVSAGRSLMGTKNEDGEVLVKDVIQDLEGTFGKDPKWVDPDDPSSKKKKPSKAKQCTRPENQGLVDAFDELAGLYFKEGSKAGLVYKKVVTAIKDMPEPLTSPPKKKEIPGVGPKSIDLIKEYLETGGMALLEEKRAAASEL